MAVITPTNITVGDDGSVVVMQWTPITFAGTDVGSAFAMAQWSDRSVQVIGTFGVGGSVRWEGSNDGTNYAVLTDPQGNALDFTTAKIETVTEITAYVRPRITAGDGDTSLTVIMLARRANPMRT